MFCVTSSISENSKGKNHEISANHRLFNQIHRGHHGAYQCNSHPLIHPTLSSGGLFLPACTQIHIAPGSASTCRAWLPGLRLAPPYPRHDLARCSLSQSAGQCTHSPPAAWPWPRFRQPACGRCKRSCRTYQVCRFI